jgi:hypothetical protein
MTWSMPLLIGALALLSPAAAAPHQAAPAPAPASAAEPLYELRIYYPAPGNLDALNARFRNHTLKLFEKHGMTNIAYWNEAPTPEQPDGRVIYVLAHRDRAAREASWQGFGADPEWKAAMTASEVNGKLVARIETVFMSRTDYSPPVTGVGPR